VGYHVSGGEPLSAGGRIATILLLEPAPDEDCERVKADTYDWSVA